MFTKDSIIRLKPSFLIFGILNVLLLTTMSNNQSIIDSYKTSIDIHPQVGLVFEKTNPVFLYQGLTLIPIAYTIPFIPNVPQLPINCNNTIDMNPYILMGQKMYSDLLLPTGMKTFFHNRTDTFLKGAAIDVGKLSSFSDLSMTSFGKHIGKLVQIHKNKIDVLDLNPYQSSIRGNYKRKRRFATLAVAGVAAIIGLTAGEVVEGAEIQRLKNALDNLVDNQDILMENIKNIHKTQQEIVDRTDGIIVSIQDIQSNFNHLSQIVECSIGYEMRVRSRISEWIKEGFFRFITNLEFATHGFVTRGILPSDVLLNLLETNVILKSSIYHQDPNLVYSVGKFTLSGISLDPPTFLGILHIPVIHGIIFGYKLQINVCPILKDDKWMIINNNNDFLESPDQGIYRMNKICRSTSSITLCNQNIYYNHEGQIDKFITKLEVENIHDVENVAHAISTSQGIIPCSNAKSIITMQMDIFNHEHQSVWTSGPMKLINGSIYEKVMIDGITYYPTKMIGSIVINHNTSINNLVLPTIRPLSPEDFENITIPDIENIKSWHIGTGIVVYILIAIIICIIIALWVRHERRNKQYWKGMNVLYHKTNDQEAATIDTQNPPE